MLETFNRTSVFRVFKHLIRSSIFRGWDRSSELPVQGLQMLLWQIFSDIDDLLIRNKSSKALWIIFGLRLQLLMERLLLQSQNLLSTQQQRQSTKIDHSIKIF